MKKELLETIENLGWLVHDCGDEFEIEQSSPLGEDFIFYASKSDTVKDIIKYARDFDADEHAELYIGMRGTHGIPNDIRALLDDASDIQDMLNELAEAVQAI